jgi:uncharacterized membrane protein (DUF441 family)
MKTNSEVTETLRQTGDVIITKVSPDGTKETYEFKNRVVDSGLTLLITRFINGTGIAPTNIMIGTGTVPVASSDVNVTALASSLISSTIVTGNTVEFRASWGAGNGVGAVTEAGIFCGGALFARTVFPVVNKLPLDELYISWIITFSAV